MERQYRCEDCKHFSQCSQVVIPNQKIINPKECNMFDLEKKDKVKDEVDELSSVQE